MSTPQTDGPDAVQAPDGGEPLPPVHVREQEAQADPAGAPGVQPRDERGGVAT